VLVDDDDPVGSWQHLEPDAARRRSGQAGCDALLYERAERLLVEVEQAILSEPHKLVDHPVRLVDAREAAGQVLETAPPPVRIVGSVRIPRQQVREDADRAVLARDLMEDGGRGAADHREALATGELPLHVEQLAPAALALQARVVQALQDAE